MYNVGVEEHLRNEDEKEQEEQEFIPTKKSTSPISCKL
jgi:hypothetical protein